jgi:hypothetical protein
MKKVSFAAITVGFLKWASLGTLGLLVSLTVSVCHDDGKYSTGSTDSLPARQLNAASMPNLTGEKAKDYLKQQGTERSLNEAIRAARYSVNWVKHAPIPEESGAFQANNPRQAYSAYFAEDGVFLVSRAENENWRVGMKLTGYGYSARIEPVENGASKVENNRIEIRKSATGNPQAEIVEW